MKIVLGSDGSIELTRGEHITRGQNKSRQVFVEWAEGFSPIDTGQFLADNMVVEMCITRPDGEQSGWQTAVKVDGEIKYLYILQAWDTAFSGQASLQVRWYDITQEEENRIIEVSNEAFFIVDNGKIAQPLNLSTENYNDIVLQFLTPLSAQAFRKYDINALPDTVTYEPDGAKTAPALFYNFTHEVIDLVDEEINEQRTVREGFLFVGKCGEVQTEVFFSSIGKIYTRSFTESPAGDFKERFEEKLLNVFSKLNFIKLNFQNGEGGGSIVQKDGGVTDSEGIPLKEKDPSNPTKYDAKAPGISAVAFNTRTEANGDCSGAGGYNAKAHTKADYAFNGAVAGLLEEEFNTLYPNGFTDTNGVTYPTYADFCKKVVNAAFAINAGKALARYSLAGGYDTLAEALYSVALGQKTKSKANGALAGGLITVVRSPHGIGWGLDLNVPGGLVGQAFFGKYNNYYHPDYQTMMEIGNGNSNSERSNAFEVLLDGRAKVFGAPSEGNDVVRLQELNDAIKNINKLTYEVVDALPTTGEKNIVYLAPNSQSPNVKDKYMWINGAWELISDESSNGTIVTVNGKAVEKFNADSKVDEWDGSASGYLTIRTRMKNNDGSMSTVLKNLSNYPVANAVPVYSGAKQLSSEMPTDPKHCVNKEFFEEVLEGKLDKVTTTSSLPRVYIADRDGNQKTYPLSEAPTSKGSEIPHYYHGGTSYGDTFPNEPVLLTGTPKKPYHCANMKYVDEQIANISGGTQLYLHKILGKGTTDGGWNLTFDVDLYAISTSSTPFGSLCEMANALDEQGLISTLQFMIYGTDFSGYTYEMYSNFSMASYSMNERVFTTVNNTGTTSVCSNKILMPSSTYTSPYLCFALPEYTPIPLQGD